MTPKSPKSPKSPKTPATPATPASAAAATAAQDALDAAYRAAFAAEERVRAVLTYGSRPAGLGDAWSDVEYWVFVSSDLLPDQARTNPPVPPDWLREVGEPALLVRNEFGAWVAVHAGLVRVEVHLWPASGVDVVRGWPARGAPVESMVVLDRDGTLTPAVAALPEHPRVPRTAAEVAEVCGRFANWWVLGHNVAGRGEWERSQDALAHVRRELLWMARLAEAGSEPEVGEATKRWLTPSRLAERDLSPEVIEALARVSARTEPADLARAYGAAWELGERLWRALVATWGFDPPDRLAEWVEAQVEAEAQAQVQA
ncbi:hypothetical protein [Actinopolymorpha rutila]|uniref:Lincosamide nucleotidyltransferase n=1 Tax=Actinopolymorpha rutila TaxID=446787 RepID=A0A852ZAA0_9ACTN|nr:hypothetical protein [Actinopolymorpha rutila]NYH89951.1 lincosamide nucleotidyltransferase [Actinopolymorpha rutila]